MHQMFYITNIFCKGSFMKHFLIISIFVFAQFFVFAQTNSNKEWMTEFEKSDYLRTPRYKETMEYFKKFEKASPYAKMITLGLSPQGRNIECLIVSKDKAFTPAAARKTGKPVVVINSGIHSGEIEGKDASMLLLREILITKEQKQLLDNAILLVIPIFSVDAHERFSEYNRINQNGPIEMGWRTTSQNYNLNRDWLKADAPEMQAMLKMYNAWLPDFFLDSHTTDGADYQYTIAYGIEKHQNLDAGLATMVKEKFMPFMYKEIEANGYLLAPYIWFKNDDPGSGLVDNAATPRFSTGYAAVQNRIALLIETHMLKPYKDRVFSTKAMFETVLKFANANGKELVSLGKAADERAIKDLSVDKKGLPVQFKNTDNHVDFLFKGIKAVKDSSEISGAVRTTYTGEKVDMTIPYYNDVRVVDTINAPWAYIIPPEWKCIAERLQLHGVQVEQMPVMKRITVTKYKFNNVILRAASYEGRQGVTCGYTSYADTVTSTEGSYIVRTNQRTVRVILHALEPKSDDSFLKWGYMNSIFERKEYFENYVMEKVAAQMIKDNPALKAEFESKLKEDKAFRESPDKRLNFFYERSPYFDKQWNVYPIMRLENPF